MSVPIWKRCKVSGLFWTYGPLRCFPGATLLSLEMLAYDDESRFNCSHTNQSSICLIQMCLGGENENWTCQSVRNGIKLYYPPGFRGNRYDWRRMKLFAHLICATVKRMMMEEGKTPPRVVLFINLTFDIRREWQKLSEHFNSTNMRENGAGFKHQNWHIYNSYC